MSERVIRFPRWMELEYAPELSKDALEHYKAQGLSHEKAILETTGDAYQSHVYNLLMTMMPPEGTND